MSAFRDEAMQAINTLESLLHATKRDIAQFSIVRIQSITKERKHLSGSFGVVFHKWDEGLYYSIALPKHGHKIVRAHECRVIGRALRLTDPPKYLDMYESFESQGRTNMGAS